MDDPRRKAIARHTHELVVKVTSGGVAPLGKPDWFFDLRRGQLRVYGALLRFIDIACKRIPKAVLKLIPAWISSYIDDCYEEEGVP